MTIGRAGAAAAVLGVLALAACSAPAPEQVVDDTVAVDIGWDEPLLSSTNSLVANGNTAANSSLSYLTSSSFNYYGGDLELERNTDFGSYEVVQEDPLTVKYTINDDVTWSDGVAVDAADMILFWGAQNDRFDTVGAGDLQYDDSGAAVVGEDEVYFSSSSAAMNLISQFPEVSDDGKSVTLTYDARRADWEVAMSQPSPVAAHVLADLALGIDDPAEGKKAVMDAFADNDTAALAQMAAVWDNAFSLTSLPDDPRLFLSYGPYILSDYVENEYVTVSRNPDYTWGPVPTVDSITLRAVQDPLAAVTALQNGEVDLISPQSTVDVLRALDDTGLPYTTGVEGTYEHLDLTFDNGGPFDPATYGGDAEKARLVREAFLKTVPRQQIVDVLIAPLQPDATTRDSFSVVPGAPNYDEVVAGNGSQAWAQVDIAGAQQLLAEAGVTTPVPVRLLYGASNARRADQFDLITASAAQAGFEVVDNGSDRWSEILGDGSYDAALFGWESTNTFALNAEANFITDGGNNYSGYSNPAVDALWEELRPVIDPARETELVIQIESLLNEDAFGLTLFQFPGVVAHAENLDGVSSIPLSPTIFWNYWEWELSPSAGGDG